MDGPAAISCPRWLALPGEPSINHQPSTINHQPSTIAIVGPTAVGKSGLGIELAERLGGEVVSVDSRCVYRCMDIGTAKPTPAERRGVPHHLIDVADPDEEYSVASFLRDAPPAIDGILR